MAYIIRGLCQTLKAVKDSVLLSKLVASDKINCGSRKSQKIWALPRPIVDCWIPRLPKAVPAYKQNLIRLPWSSLIRSFQINANCGVTRGTSRTTPVADWTPAFHFWKFGYKTCGTASLTSLFLSLPLIPLVHCEGLSSTCGCCDPVGQQTNNINSCSHPFLSTVPNAKCGGSCDPSPPSENSPVVTTDITSAASPPTSSIIPPPPPDRNGMVPMNWCEATDLSHKVLVRQACQLTVDSVTRVLCETIAAYQDYHDKYRCLLDALIDALESSRITEGVHLELLDCKIIMMRAEVENMKGKILELESFMSSIQRLADATAETAFLGHAEYHSVAMSERLESAMREMKVIKEESARKERDMIELQSVVIVESGRGLK